MNPWGILGTVVLAAVVGVLLVLLVLGLYVDAQLMSH
jgi:hypothetical protein